MKYLYLILIFLPMALLAQAVADNSIAPNDWISNGINVVLGILNSIPAVGQYMVEAIKILVIVSAVLTVVSAALMALAKIFNWSGLNAVESWILKILPYVQYASMFNVQKKS